MREYLEALFEKHRDSGLLIDSNLLLLFFVGLFRKDLIGRYKRLSAFTPEDYKALALIVKRFTRVVTTPNILTEVSNLSTALPDETKAKYFEAFRNVVTVLDERYVASVVACTTEAFVHFGLTDAVIEQLAEGTLLVLTADFRLYQYLLHSGFDALNFNHLRSAAWN